MTKIIRSARLAAFVLAVSTGGAMAQSNHDSGAPGGMVAQPSSPNQSGSPAATNPRVAGATGSTVVPGDNSSISADRRATVEQKTGGGGAAGGGGGN